jgi:hypothetical protein
MNALLIAMSSGMLKKTENRLLMRAAQNCAHLFAATYRAATVRERPRRTLFRQPARPWRTRRPGSCAGASVIEMALILPLLLGTIFASLTVGLVLERLLSVLQVVRYAGSMYARGTDFNVASNKTLLLMGAGGLGITATGGTGVIYLSAVVKAGPGTTYHDQLVIAERFVIGSSSFASSRVGTPSVSIWPDTTKPLPNGQVHDFENQPSALATLPAAFSSIGYNERIYVVEVCDGLTDLVGGYVSLLHIDRFYIRAFF